MKIFENKHTLGISSDEAMTYFNEIAKHSNYDVKFLNDLDIGSGFAKGDDLSSLYVGVGNFAQVKTPRVNDEKFVQILVALYHEIEHADQFYCKRYDSCGKSIAISDMAFRFNAGYYKQNYFKNPCEIDAERVGISNSYMFLVYNSGEDKANELMCKYVNNRIKNNCSFIKPKDSKYYTDVYDILEDFEKAFDKSIHSHRIYDVRQGLSYNDSLAKYLSKEPKVANAFLSERDGLVQDSNAAAIALYHDGNTKYADNISVLQKLSLPSESFSEEIDFSESESIDDITI